jgi:hypothetical protein|tara:strand:+ start:1055 stop:1429 length:375 start_codon:yes stop_codon:yes gene_type:complete
MDDPRATTSRLRKADGRRYAEICSIAGCYSEAIKACASMGGSLNYLETATIAKRIGDSPKTKRLCALANEKAESELEETIEQAASSDNGSREERTFTTKAIYWSKIKKILKLEQINYLRIKIKN